MFPCLLFFVSSVKGFSYQVSTDYLTGARRNTYKHLGKRSVLYKSKRPRRSCVRRWSTRSG